MSDLDDLLAKIRACSICEAHLPHGVRPVVQAAPEAPILIAGQAPGAKVHASGIPFDDASGERLRDWLGIDKSSFYDPEKVAILPMGFCYPGTGKSGDMPPRRECVPQWRVSLLKQLPNLKLTLVIGAYAMKWHLGSEQKKTLTETVRNWRSYYDKGLLPLPHPSPRNNIWLRRNRWFEEDITPTLRKRVATLIR